MKNKIDLQKLLNKPTAVFQKFHQQTKNNPTGDMDPNFLWPKTWTRIYYKSYPRFPKIALPKPKLSHKISLVKAIFERKSSRNFRREKPLPLQQLSTLLGFSAGLMNINQPKTSRRFYPSAGARYPLELYLISLNTELPPAIYHYYPVDHLCEKIRESENLDLKRYFAQDWSNSLFIVLISAFFLRNIMKYGDRGYREILMETGHLGQNIYLISTALHLSCCAIDGFFDNKVNQLLDLDGINEAVIYCFAIGK